MRYAYFCLDLRVKRGQIRQFEADELTRCVDQNEEPDTRLLVNCYQAATGRFAQETGFDIRTLSDWPTDLVRPFWRKHKGRVRQCDTVVGKVLSFNEISALIAVGDKKFRAFNRYKLPIATDDLVYCHLFGIAEVEKDGSI